MSESQPPQQSSRPAAKPRNPVEKFLVRGLIAVLLVLVAIEGYFRLEYGKVLGALQEKVAAVDKQVDSKPVTEADVKAIVGDRKPSRTEDFGPSNPSPNGAKRMEVYTWFTLRPGSKREICVFYGTKGHHEDVAEVIAVQTDDQIEAIKAPEPAAGQGQAAAGGGTMMGPPGGMGGPGMRGGGRGGPPGQHDPNATNDAKPASDGDKPDADKSADEKPDEKPTEAKTEKSDSDQE